MRRGLIPQSSEVRRDGRWPAPRLVVAGVIGGMFAGMAMAMVEMGYDLFSDTRSVWESPMAIAAWVFGEEHFTPNDPGAHVGPVVLGLMGHMMNSAMVGILFVGLMRALRVEHDLAAIVLGVAYAFGVWALMRYVILPLNEGEAELFTTDAVTPQGIWWLAHVAFGMTAGVAYSVARRRWTARGGTLPSAP